MFPLIRCQFSNQFSIVTVRLHKSRALRFSVCFFSLYSVPGGNAAVLNCTHLYLSVSSAYHTPVVLGGVGVSVLLRSLSSLSSNNLNHSAHRRKFFTIQTHMSAGAAIDHIHHDINIYLVQT